MSLYSTFHSFYAQLQIAKMRAARKLWAEMVKAKYNPKNDKSLLLRTHCQTSGYSLTQAQPMNNIIRTTIEAMAAIQGGTQSLHTNAYDEAVGLPTEQTARVTRSTQLILQDETGICDVADPWGGSYMMEALSDELLVKAQAIINQVEEAGGMTAFTNSGTAKMMIEESATKKQGRIDSEQEIVVGVNKYRLSDEDEKKEMIDVLQIDNDAVRQGQIERIEKIKASRDNAAVEEVLAKIEASARKTVNTSDGDDPDNLMKLCIDAARVRYVLILVYCCFVSDSLGNSRN
jgi:methylmalonyl-CoA mutase